MYKDNCSNKSVIYLPYLYSSSMFYKNLRIYNILTSNELH